MADTKLSALTELAATPAVDDEVYIRDISEAAADESKRITIANLFTSPTLASPTINGTIATTGLTLPAVTLGGTVNASANAIIGLDKIQSVDSIYDQIIRTGTKGWLINTENATSDGTVTRLWVASVAAVARIQVVAGACLNVAGGTHGTPVEGDLRINAAKLEVYLDAAWEVVTSV